MRQKALLIGVDDCAFAPLTSCVNDAVALRDLLVRLELFAPAECTLMTSPARPDSAARPTRDAVLDWLLPLYEAAEPLDRLLVYFAGHGLSVRLGREADVLRTVLVPAGVDALRNAGGRMLDLDELLGRFARRGARQQHWIIDACRNLPPDGVVPNIAGIGWDTPAPGDPRDAVDMAREVLFAVAPLGEARAASGGHGLLTSHVLDGLACAGPAQWGAAGEYDETSDAWLISLDSLCDYAARRIGADLAPGDWRREYLLPRIWRGERAPAPLRDAGALPDRTFGLFVEPPEAGPALSASLSVKRNRVAQWPPRGIGEQVDLPPERYRLAASLLPGASGWRAPTIADPIVDLRETDRVVLRVEAIAPAVSGAPVSRSLGMPASPLPTAGSPGPTPAPAGASEHFVPPSFVPDRNAPKLPGYVRFLVTPESGHFEVSPPSLIVRAIDPGATARLTSLSGRREQRNIAVNTRTTLAEGLWRIEVMLGDEVIAVHEEDVADGHAYEVSATAQITPALAALLPEVAEGQPPPADLMPSETIGPMQGAILPSLLPTLALKPFDSQGLLLQQVSADLGIPRLPPYGDAPAAIAVALDGAWDDVSPIDLAPGLAVTAGLPAQLVWCDFSGRISLFAEPDTTKPGAPRPGGIRIALPDWGSLDIAAPRLPGHIATVAATLWRDGRWDLSVNLFRLPLGADEVVRPGRLARAQAIASRLYRAHASLDDVDYDVFSVISYGSWAEPVLGALAWFGRARAVVPPDKAADIAMRQDGVRNFLLQHAPALPDTRIIAALAMPEPMRGTALDDLLDDAGFTQPVLADALVALARHALARDRREHWSVLRYQALAENAVFNAIRIPPDTVPPEPGAAP